MKRIFSNIFVWFLPKNRRLSALTLAPACDLLSKSCGVASPEPQKASGRSNLINNYLNRIVNEIASGGKSSSGCRLQLNLATCPSRAPHLQSPLKRTSRLSVGFASLRVAWTFISPRMGTSMLVLFVYPIRMDWTAMPETAIHPIPIHYKGTKGTKVFLL